MAVAMTDSQMELMVSKVAYDDDDAAWEIYLNENYTISTAKKLQGTITFTLKSNKDTTYDVDIDEVVSNHLVTVEGYKKVSDAEDDVIDADDNTLYQCDEDNPGYICFNDGRLLSCTLKMVKNEKAFMPVHTGQHWVLGSAPKVVGQEQKILEAVFNSMWVSRPMTIS